MIFEYNRDSEALYNVLKFRAKKENLIVKKEKGKISVWVDPQNANEGLAMIPVVFKGTLYDSDEGCKLSGRFTYGFLYETLLWFSLMLIALRTALSIYLNQTKKIIVCAIVSVLFVAVVIVVITKSRQAKIKIKEVLSNLNKK